MSDLDKETPILRAEAFSLPFDSPIQKIFTNLAVSESNRW